MEILCLQHVSFEGPGRLREWLERKGCRLRCLLLSEEELPDPAGLKAVVIMGGPMNIYQHRDHPWLVNEKAFIRECLEREIPLLGICLGAQLLADALGARVYQNREREIGWFPVRFSAEIAGRFPGMGRQLTVLHWHGDTFELPQGSIRVGWSDACGEQGFLVPGKCLGLQFHPEATPESLAALIGHCGDELTPGSFVQSGGELETGGYDHEFSVWEPLLAELFVER